MDGERIRVQILFATSCWETLIRSVTESQVWFGDNNNLTELQFVYDEGCGCLIARLEQLEPHTKRILVTDNPCPEYLEYLKCFEPSGLLFSPKAYHIEKAIEAVQAGEIYVSDWLKRTALTFSECQIVYYAARGDSNPEIAKAVGKEEGTVKNMLSRAFDKICDANPYFLLENRVHLSRYFHGNLEGLKAEYNQRKPFPWQPRMVQKHEDFMYELSNNELLENLGFRPHEKNTTRAKAKVIRMFGKNSPQYKRPYGTPQTKKRGSNFRGKQ